MAVASHVLQAVQDVVAVVVDERVALALEAHQRLAVGVFHHFVPAVVVGGADVAHQRQLERGIADLRDHALAGFLRHTVSIVCR